jgi:hypothetical protein
MIGKAGRGRSPWQFPSDSKKMVEQMTAKLKQISF